jgi:predicted dehydrogenase
MWLESETELIGSSGVARLQVPSESLSLLLEAGHQRPDPGLSALTPGQASGALKEELTYFAHCVLNGTPPTRLTPADGVESLRIALAAIRSEQSGSAEALEP